MTDRSGAASRQPRPSVAPLERRAPLLTELGHPFSWGFAVTLGGLAAIALGSSLVSLSTVLVYLGVALFMALGLDPLVRWLESHGMTRALSISVVFVGFALVFSGLLAVIIPAAVAQVPQLADQIPAFVDAVINSPWLAYLGEDSPVDELLRQAQTYLSDPSNLMAIAGGALAIGQGIVTGFTGAMMVLILTLYFLSSLTGMKQALYRLVPAYARADTEKITEQITASVGGYVMGMLILAACNAVVSFVLLSILGVPLAPLLAVLALFITMIPMVGSVTFWILATIVCLVNSWWVALVFAGVYFAYMQVEAYVMTPRIMNRAISIPGSLVIISALVGGTLLGLLGALVAVPVAASVLLVLENVVLPRQDAKLIAPEGYHVIGDTAPGFDGELREPAPDLPTGDDPR